VLYRYGVFRETFGPMCQAAETAERAFRAAGWLPPICGFCGKEKSAGGHSLCGECRASGAANDERDQT
jgi:hypothetical protein